TNDIITSTIHGIDLGVRGYALTRDDKLLDPYTSVSTSYVAIFSELETALKKQGFPEMEKFYALRKEVEAYFDFTAEMIQMVQEDRMDDFTARLKQDKGYDVWLKFAAFQTPMLAFENKLYDDAAHEYEAAIQNNL